MRDGDEKRVEERKSGSGVREGGGGTRGKRDENAHTCDSSRMSGTTADRSNALPQ
jgi:hypothetical protein